MDSLHQKEPLPPDTGTAVEDLAAVVLVTPTSQLTATAMLCSKHQLVTLMVPSFMAPLPSLKHLAEVTGWLRDVVNASSLQEVATSRVTMRAPQLF